MSDDLVRRFRLLQEALNHGCSDGGCVIEVTKGQHTNGGCKCLYHPEQYTLNRVGHMLRCAQDMADHIEELESNIKELFVLLERTEQTDEGRLFHPVRIYCNREMDRIKLEQVLRKLKGEKVD